MTASRERALLWALLAGNFVIGTGVMMPAGMMNVLAEAFSLSVPQAGRLIWAGAITMGIGAPLMAQLASPIDRRVLLVSALALYVGGHLASALCDGFGQLLAARIVTVVGAAVFTPQAAAAVSALLPPARRSAGVTFVFLGWSVASAAGMPMGSYLGAALGWRAVYLIEASMALAAALAVAATLPRGVRAPAVSLQTWQLVARHAPLLLALAVTVVQMGGQFAVSTYLAPEMLRRFEASPATIAGMFALFGLCGVAGSVVVARLVHRFSPGRAVTGTLGIMVAGLLVWSASGRSLPIAAAALVLWGLGSFATNSLQQARLIDIEPSLAPASVALNSSGLYAGQAVGALTGAALIAAQHPDWLGPLGAVLIVAAIWLSRRTDRARAARHSPA